MFKIKIRTKTNQRAIGDLHSQIALTINKVAEHLRGRIVENISTPTRSAGPSLPGAFPNVDTGKLRQSIQVSPATKNDLVAEIGRNLEYADHLEFGTDRMAARPFLVRTLEEEEAMIKNIVKRASGKK